MTQTRIERAIAASLPYWSEEFAIGYRAFASAAIYADGTWLAVQIEKERSGSGVYGPADGHEVPRDQLAEEHVHAELLRALAPLLGTAPPAPELPSSAKLVALRNASWPDPALRNAVAMSEGGGLGLFKGALAAIADRVVPRSLDAQFSAVLDRIIADERGHVASGFAAFVTADPARDDEVLARLEAILALKVAERREQFVEVLRNMSVLDVDSVGYASWASRAFFKTSPNGSFGLDCPRQSKSGPGDQTTQNWGPAKPVEG